MPNKLKKIAKFVARCFWKYAISPFKFSLPYPVNATVSRYIHSVCDKCTFCKIYVEDIEHLFFFCPFSISFWVDFKVDITKKVNKALNLDPHHILLCFQKDIKNHTDPTLLSGSVCININKPQKSWHA